ncbi:MAG: patatin-like phospholipase family protein [Pseudomonadota bacterium]
MSMVATSPLSTGALRRMGRIAVTGLLLALAAGCTTVIARFPASEEQTLTAKPYGIDNGFIRAYGDNLGEELRAQILRDRVDRAKAFRQAGGEGPVRISSIAFSGGGPDGAFGAGLLAGWTARGDRPTFGFVSGVSTGAILALYAYLGPQYDEALKEIYTSYETDDLVTPTIFAGLTGGTALLSTAGYRKLIEDYISPAVVAELAAAHKDGRILLIGTTNIDASRPVVWNVGQIAASGHPDARRLIHDIVQASSAIPAAFPPVLIPVIDENGRRFDEMHVDGGATQQVILYSPEFSTRALDKATGVEVNREVFVVVNNKLRKAYDPVSPRIFSIAGRAASSLIGGSGTGDIYRIFTVAQRDGIDFNVIAIPTEFDAEAESLFDPAYMQSLYDLGFEYGEAGDRWSPYPLDYITLEEAIQQGEEVATSN